MNYADWVREGEAELAALPRPTREEDRALQLALDAENAALAAEDEVAAQEEATASDER